MPAVRSGRGGMRGGGGFRAVPYVGGGVARVCDNCGNPGHLASQCPSDPTCYACGSTGHAKNDCPNLGKTCDLCHKVGHLKFKCRLAAGGGFQGGFQQQFMPQQYVMPMRGGMMGGMGGRGGMGGGNPGICYDFQKGICQRGNACRFSHDMGGGMMMGGGGSGGGNKTCDNCHASGHLASQCPNPPQCHCCGSTTHGKADCPSIGKVCDLCGKTGHLKIKCRQAYY